MLPLGLIYKSRASENAVRLLSPSPHRIDVSKDLNIIVDDVVRCMKDVVIGVDPYGRRVRIFLQVVSYFGHYPAVSTVCTLKGHTSLAFFTSCIFQKRASDTMPGIIRTFAIHGRRIGYSRFLQRMISIKNGSPSSVFCKFLGIYEDERWDDGFSDRFFLRWSESLSKTKPFFFVDGNPVVSLSFDPYLGPIAAPDHLLTELVKNVLTICFNYFRNSTDRKIL